jgi:cysteinyl-tRNA synthetase
MSKSLGNVFTVRDVLDRGFRASALRYLLISVHYRKQLLFNWDVLTQADAAVTRLADFVARVDALAADRPPNRAIAERLARARREFRELIGQDLNVPGALGTIFELVREMHAAMDHHDVGRADAEEIRQVMDEVDRVLGVLVLRRAEDARPPMPADEIERLVTLRREARHARDFARADEIRKDLDAKGIVLEDTAAGTRWKRK